MAGVLAVVRPHMNGVGGDNFMLIRLAKTGEIVALNGSGRAGQQGDAGILPRQGADGRSGVPAFSRSPCLARCAAWADALQKYGTITLSQALQPAIRYAERGFPVSPRLNADITESKKKVAADPGARAHLPA